MILKANQKYIDTSSIAHLLVNGEKNADTVYFQVDRFYNNIDLSSCVFTLRAVNENLDIIEQTLKQENTNEYIMLEWNIDEYFTAVNGSLNLEIKATKNNDLTLKYTMHSIYIRQSLSDVESSSILVSKNSTSSNFVDESNLMSVLADNNIEFKIDTYEEA